jgi:hypothetical protein
MNEPNIYESRFSAYAQEFEGFASSHNLLVEKYYHDAPMWSFCFGHPRGGQAKLDVTIDETGSVTLQSVWWIDSYAEFTRSLKWGSRVVVAQEPSAVGKALREGLIEAVSWAPGEWTQIAAGYRPIWGQYSEAEFRAMTPQWPSPTI